MGLIVFVVAIIAALVYFFVFKKNDQFEDEDNLDLEGQEPERVPQDFGYNARPLEGPSSTINTSAEFSYKPQAEFDTFEEPSAPVTPVSSSSNPKREGFEKFKLMKRQLSSSMSQKHTGLTGLSDQELSMSS